MYSHTPRFSCHGCGTDIIYICPIIAEEEAGGTSSGGYTVLVQYHAPCIMPWLWDEAAPGADARMRPSHIGLRAGSHGARLTVL